MENTKVIEKLFEAGNFDHKNITNKCNQKVDQKYLDIIEAQGATFELLETIGVPVFKYQTQITIHGLFSELNNNRIGGYYNIFQNKNLSIGVKYTAIDRLKKERIFKILRALYGWNIENNSSDYCAYFWSSRFDTKEKYLELLPQFNEIAAKINTSLFFGGSGVELVKGMFGYYIRVALHIGSISEVNVNELILGITGKSEAGCMAEIEVNEQKEREERERAQQEREREAAILAEKMQPYCDAAAAVILAAGYVKKIDIALFDGLILAGASVNRETFEITYNFRKFIKSKAQKKFRYVTGTASVFDVAAVTWGTYENQTNKTTAAGWMLPTAAAPVPAKKAAAVPAVPVPVSVPVYGGVKIINYSDRSIAVIGDTKPIKDVLKAAGGCFNFRLTCGAGWIFPASKKETIKKLCNV